jgi:hypothetical protein
VMSKFLDEKKPMEVRELAKLVREDWRFRLETPLRLTHDFRKVVLVFLFDKDQVYQGVNCASY